MPEQGRWVGPTPIRDLVRHRIWHALKTSGVAVGPAPSMIPNFVGVLRAPRERMLARRLA